MIEDDPEPESPEAESIDSFFEAIADGKGAQAACALIRKHIL
jgi:hypothetical protein